LNVTSNLLLPFVSLPKDTTPVFSANSALSLGILASNKSATLGSPPVISLVPDISLRVLAIISPTPTFYPSIKNTLNLDGKI
jgi:hypothetical protein